MKGRDSLSGESFAPWVVKNSVCDCIDVSYAEVKSKSVYHRILNASNVLGTIAFMSMIAFPGAVESEMYITAIVLIAVMAVCVYLSMKEDGKIK